MAAAKSNAPRPQHPRGLAQGQDPVGPLGQVVERAQHQHDIGRGVGVGQRSGIALTNAGERLRTGGRRLPGLPDVFRHGIEQVNLVAALGQPIGVRAGCTADVEDDLGGARRRGRPIPQDELPGARLLQREVVDLQAARLVVRLVERGHVGEGALARGHGSGGVPMGRPGGAAGGVGRARRTSGRSRNSVTSRQAIQACALAEADASAFFHAASSCCVARKSRRVTSARTSGDASG